MMVQGEVAGKLFKGNIIKKMPNRKLHVQVDYTENTEWQRDIAKGHPVIISVKQDDVVSI